MTDQEVIGVAGARCLACDTKDLRAVILACEKRRASIYCLDTQRLFNPAIDGFGILKLFDDFEEASRRQQTSAARRTAHDERSKQAAAKREKIEEFARPLWESPNEEVSSAQIVADVRAKFRSKTGLSSLHKWLGSRESAQAEAAKRRTPQ